MAYDKFKAKFLCSVILALTPLSMAFAQKETPQKAAGTPSASPAAPKPAQKAIDPSSLTVQDFARLPFVEQPRLSPDGKRVAGLIAIAGQQRIVIMSLFDKAEKLVQIFIPEQSELTFISWVNNDNIIVGISALDRVEGERTYLSRLIAVNRTSGAITKLLWDSAGQNAADVLWIPHDGSSKILVAAQYSFYTNEAFWPTVYKVDVTNGRKESVLSGREGVLDWYADNQGTVRSGIRNTSKGIKRALLYRGEGSNGNFHEIDKSDVRKEGGLLNPFLFLPGTNNALATHDDENGLSGIYEIDLTTGNDVRTVFSAPAGREIAATYMSVDGASLLGVTTSGLDSGMHWFDPALAALQQNFDKAVGSKRARIISYSDDRKNLLVLLDRADMPGSIYFYNVDDGTMKKIADMNEAIGSQRLSPVQAIHYKARDGLEIEAILTLPKGLEAKNLPIVMMPHGGPWGQDTLNYDYWAQFIASRGYAVLQPNFRGSTGYGQQFEDKGKGQLGLAMQDDITDGLRWAVDQGIADPKRACIVGASYGGYAAMWGIVKDPDQYRCAIAISGVASLRRETNDFGRFLLGARYRFQWQEMSPDFAAVSPTNFVDKITKPLLLIHGKKDVTVDHGQSSSMFNKMKTAGKDVQFVSLPEADHYFTRQADREVLLSSIETFLKANNPAGPVK